MNTILETGISLVLIFFIFSVVTYVIQELIAVNLKLRGKMLWKAMSQLLDGFGWSGRMKLMGAVPQGQAATTFTNEFYDHGHIKGLHKDLKKMPSYIPAANFALTVIDMIAKRAPQPKGELLTDFKAGLEGFVASDGNFYNALKSIAAASATIQELQQKIEDWFNDYMKQVSGWYQSHTVATVRIIAIAVTLLFNLNTIKIADAVYHDSQLRTAMVAMAENITDQPQTVTSYYDKAFDRETAQLDSLYKNKLKEAATKADTIRLQHEQDSVFGKAVDSFTSLRQHQIKAMLDSLKTTGLPMGWQKQHFWTTVLGKSSSNEPFSFLQMLVQLFGWLITAGALSMGAPFWFDILGKAVNLRRLGVKPKAAGGNS
jgi:hypothetical protein